MSHIFISHSSQDDNFVSQLADQLQGVGVATWVDHQNIPAGANWDRAIETNINDCRVMLFVVTQASLDSAVCAAEWNHALSLNIPIIPLLLGEGLGSNHLPFRLKMTQWVDFRGDFTTAFRKLSAALGGDNTDSPVPATNGFRLPMLEWIEIPAGHVQIMGAPYVNFDFQISKYPVTVEQYSYFVNDGGYTKSNYWTQIGWVWRGEQDTTQPRFWNDPQWNQPQQPIVGVCWYEAIAFTTWLGEKLHQTISLPTEQQWQYAAQGRKDNRAYPWGDTFVADYCNTSESNLNQTTPVTHYPENVSPFGVQDMSGNVWEWCLNEWDYKAPAGTFIHGYQPRTLRGGSWAYDQTIARCDSRSAGHASGRDNSSGFRVVRP